MTVNIANGFNYDIVQYESLNTPNLTCINVDDSEYSTLNWENIDAVSNFSESCEFLSIALNENAETEILISPNPAHETLSIKFKDEVVVVSISIYDLL